MRVVGTTLVTLAAVVLVLGVLLAVQSWQGSDEIGGALGLGAVALALSLALLVLGRRLRR